MINIFIIKENNNNKLISIIQLLKFLENIIKLINISYLKNLEIIGYKKYKILLILKLFKDSNMGNGDLKIKTGISCDWSF